MITILDVIDNFFSSKDNLTFNTMSGTELYKFGEEVRRFSESYMPPQARNCEQPIYLGGWPSANFWCSYDGQLVMSSLLYAGQILVKDPISDWFSYEQYKYPTKMAARTGFIDTNNNRINTIGTRQFLSIVVPELIKLRPLIEKGIIVLIPSKSYIYKKQNLIKSIAESITSSVSNDIENFTRRFSPVDLATEDNIRGLFAFAAGNNKEEQIKYQIRNSVKYFVSEYLLATEYGFDYTAPFEYESYLCEEVLEKALMKTPGARVLKAIFNSELAIFKGLTPKLVAEIKDDDNFAFFRSQLFQIYKDIPQNSTQSDLQKYIWETENTQLKPILEKVEKELNKGALSKYGIVALSHSLKIAGSVLFVNIFTPSNPVTGIKIAAGTELVNIFSDYINKRKSTGDTISLWKKLYHHNKSFNNEISRVKITSPINSELNKNKFWGIPDGPGNLLHVTKGALIMDFVPQNNTTKISNEYPPSNIYDLCPCGSGIKYKFCCKGLEKIKLFKS